MERAGEEVADHVVVIEKQPAGHERGGLLEAAFVPKATGLPENLHAARQPLFPPDSVPDARQAHIVFPRPSSSRPDAPVFSYAFTVALLTVASQDGTTQS